MLIEMANPFQASLIICPPIGSGFDNPVAWKVGLWVPVGEMVGTLDDQERREAPPFGINTFDCRSPFPIARLDGLTSAVSIGASNYHWGAANDAHHEASLIEVVEVAISNAVLRPHVVNQLEPRANEFRILAGSSLEIVYAI